MSHHTGMASMSIEGFDHVAIPIGNVEKMFTFYRKLGFSVEEHDLDGLPLKTCSQYTQVT